MEQSSRLLGQVQNNSNPNYITFLETSKNDLVVHSQYVFTMATQQNQPPMRNKDWFLKNFFKMMQIHS
jgi:hypothetical protein